MHSSRELSSQMFEIEEAGGRLSSFAELCPGFTAQSRLGVVVREPLGAIAGSAFIMAAVTAFYDAQRASGGEYFIYPDFFVFHVDCAETDYGMLDIWPQHKCVRVDDNPEAILSAINDRGVTILLVRPYAGDAMSAHRGQLRQHTRNSALSRIEHAFISLSSPEPGAIRITGDPVVERYVESVITASVKLPEEVRTGIHTRRLAALHAGRAVENYRRLTVESALDML
jgi:hypothetical protein